MKVKNGVLFLLIVLSMVIAGCDDGSGKDDDFLKDLGKSVMEIGNMEFLGGAGGVPDKDRFVSFMRIMVFLLVFTLFYFGGAWLPGAGGSNNLRIALAFILAAISVVAIPSNILIGIAGAYGAIVAFVLMGVPVFLGGLAIYFIPSNNRGQILIKIAVIVLLLWILRAIKSYATSMPRTF